jgi:hypothetical protein
MKATQNKSRPVQGVIDALVGGSSGEPVAGAAATAVKAEGAATAVTESGKGSKKSGRPQASPKQGDSATAVQRKDGKPTRAQKREASSQQWAEVLQGEMEEDRQSQYGEKAELRWKPSLQDVMPQGEVVPVSTYANGKPIGRPLEYTPEQGAELCQWIREGKGLVSWCKKTGRAPDAVYRWLRSVPSFREAYERAQEDRGDTLADQLLELVDALPPDATMEQVQIAKLRLDARKWIASKLRPGKWGDKQVVEHTGGGISIQIGIPQKPAQPAIEAVDVQAKRLE